MTDPQTMKYWEGMTEHFTYQRVVEGYWENVREQVWQCMIEYRQKAIGYCPFCVLNASYYEVPQIQYDKFVGKRDLYMESIFLLAKWRIGIPGLGLGV